MLNLFRRLAPDLPVSLAWFAFTAIVFVLQAIPVTGIFLMVLLAPFWSIVTVNLGFVSLGVEALMGRTSRLWLLAPVVWFGGYAIAAHLSQAEFDRLDAQIRAENAGKTVAFSPERDALVFARGDSPLSGSAARFVADYGLPVVYEANRYDKTTAHIAHRMGDARLCAEIRSPAYRNAGIHSSGAARAGKLSGQGCRYHAPEEPVLPAVRVSAKSQRIKDGNLPSELTHIEIARDGLAPVRLVTGMGAPLSRWPLPTIGCWLNASRPNWQCQAGFARGLLRGLGGEGAYGGATMEVIAAALGLSKTEGDKPVTVDPAAKERLRQTISKSVDDATAMLDRMIADPTTRATVHDVPGLRERPDILVERADGMVRAAAAALDGGHRTREVGRILQGLLSHLPPKDFERIGPTLLAELAARPRIDSDMISAELAARLGDLGDAAVGVLGRLAFESGRRGFAGAIYGLCRVGAPAAPLAGRVAAELAKHKRITGEAHAASYLALLRMGRPDLADADPDADARYARKHYISWRASVTPDSPRSVCVSSHGWPRLPDVKS